MKSDIKSKIEHCYALAEHGTIELAQSGLRSIVEDFCTETDNSFGRSESTLQDIQKTSHRIGVEVALQFAEHFYENGDRGAARDWLRYAKMHAKQLKLDIAENISEMKRKYGDRIPILF